MRLLLAILLFTPALHAFDSEKSAAYFKQGLLDEGAKRYDVALKNFALSFAEDPSSTGFYREMGNCYYYKGLKIAARDCYGKYLKFKPTDQPIARVHQALLAQKLAAAETIPPFATDVTPLSTIHYRVDINHGVVDARKKAARLNKPLLYFVNGASALNRGTVGSQGDIVKAITRQLFDDEQYAAWIDEHYVLCDLSERSEYMQLSGYLTRAKKLGSAFAPPLLIAANNDWTDFRWDYSFIRPEATMLFLVESLRDLAKPKQ